MEKCSLKSNIPEFLTISYKEESDLSLTQVASARDDSFYWHTVENENVNRQGSKQYTSFYEAQKGDVINIYYDFLSNTPHSTGEVPILFPL